MTYAKNYSNEIQAAIAFDAQAPDFDRQYNEDLVIRYKRKRVHEHVLQLLQPQSHILELNSGTGEDALYFARNGHTVHATDISPGMQNILREKVVANTLDNKITYEQCSYTSLGKLLDKGPYDCIFSNFAGLNCTNDLNVVFGSFNKLLRPDGLVILVILPKFCLWESLLLFKGKFKTATRRFFSDKGRKASINGLTFTCWYHSPGQVIRLLENDFETVDLQGLCTIVPPSYIEKFGEKYPRLFRYLCKSEDKYKRSWLWKNIGDYFIITLRKK